MILPIVAYGDPVLRKIGEEICEDYPKLSQLITDMKETMYNAEGVGLAAPQVGVSIRLFIIDASPFAKDKDLEEEERMVLSDFNQVFINPKIIEQKGDEWTFNEGCLSIPDVRENVFRQSEITVEYKDENFKVHKKTLNGLAARIFQHEYDHIEGILFTDKLSSLKKRLIKKKLENISKGEIKTVYKMRFPILKKIFMKFSKIIAITGKPGLFEVVSQTKTGVILKSLTDGKRSPVITNKNVSLLENISIFTYQEEVPLLTVFKTIFDKEDGKKAINHKESNSKLVEYFSEILPDFDQERVYVSNIKKILQWYNTLVSSGFDFSKAEETTEEITE